MYSQLSVLRTQEHPATAPRRFLFCFFRLHFTFSFRAKCCIDRLSWHPISEAALDWRPCVLVYGRLTNYLPAQREPTSISRLLFVTGKVVGAPVSGRRHPIGGHTLTGRRGEAHPKPLCFNGVILLLLGCGPPDAAARHVDDMGGLRQALRYGIRHIMLGSGRQRCNSGVTTSAEACRLPERPADILPATWGLSPPWRVVIAGLLLASNAFAQGPVLAIENPVGQVEIRVRHILEFEVRSTSPVRDVTTEDVEIERRPEGPLIRCRPKDGARVDLTVDVPYDTSLSVSTTQGDIRLSGLVKAADITTHGGAVQITTPWKAVNLTLKVERAPPDVSLPSVVEFHTRTKKGSLHLKSRLPHRFHEPYSEIRVRAESPSRVVLRDMQIPEDSPFKMHWQAPEVLAELFRPTGQKELKVRGGGRRRLIESVVEPRAGGEGDLTFRAETRLVSLSVSVTDKDGAPVTDLRPSDFEVSEGGERQQVESAQLESRRTNFVLMLDWSGSTKAHRELSKDSALRFAEMLRPDDRIAVYVMVQARFQLVCGLTSSRDELRRNLNSLAILQAMNADWGGSPIYDSLVLSYAQELPSYHGEHNVLVAVTDGWDTHSLVSFDKLRRAAAEMRAVIYPIALHGLSSMRGADQGANVRAEYVARGRLRLQLLADASGGRLFPAASMADLEPVYPQFAREMKSLYTVTYYPKNQRLDGKWRKLQVKVGRPSARVRTRAGYFAR